MTVSLETQQQLLARLAGKHLGVSPDDVSIERLAGDASTRAYFRAKTENSSVVVAVYREPFDVRQCAAERLAIAESNSPTARLTFANDPCAHIEVTGLLLDAGLPVPRALSISGDDAVMLIEDVGDIRLQDWMSNRPSEQINEAYRRAIELIVRIQDATQAALEADSICCHLAFDEAKLRWELGFFFANYFNNYLHVRLEPSESITIQTDFKTLCTELSARPRVLTHRDYHARNLMMHDGEMYIIDYQDARMGPASYDVASLLSDPYTHLVPEVVEELVQYFMELKSQSRIPLEDLDGFRSELDLMTVQRMLKALGTYTSQAAAGNPVYIPYIAPAIDRALAAMSRLGRFSAVQQALVKHRD